MSGAIWTWKPAFNAVVTNGPLATPVAPVPVRIDFAGTLTLTHFYRVVAAFDGVPLLGATLGSPSGSVTGAGATPYGVVVNIVAVPGATSYRVYRDGFLIAVTSQLAIFDSGQPTTSEPVPGGVGSTFYLIDMAPVYVSGPRPPWLERSKARVTSVEYSDLSDPEAYKSVRRSLVTKEFGCRPIVEMTFQVVPGSVEDQQLTALWDWKMAFPEPPAPGVKLFFTLTSANARSSLVEVRIVGPLRREPTSDKNVLVVNSWKIMTVEPYPSVPDLSFAINGTGWWV